MPHTFSKYAKKQNTNVPEGKSERILHLKRSPKMPPFTPKNNEKAKASLETRHHEVAGNKVIDIEAARTDVEILESEVTRDGVTSKVDKTVKNANDQAANALHSFQLPHKADTALICSQYTPCIMQVIAPYNPLVGVSNITSTGVSNITSIAASNTSHTDSAAFINWLQQVLALGEGLDAQPYAARTVLLKLASNSAKLPNLKAPNLKAGDAPLDDSEDDSNDSDDSETVTLPDATAAFWEGIQIAHKLLLAQRLPQSMNRTTYMHMCRTVAAAREEFEQALHLGWAQASLILYSLENFDENLQSRLTLKSQKSSISSLSSISSNSFNFATKDSSALYQLMFGSELKITAQTTLQQALQQCSPALSYGFALHYLPAVQLLIEKLLRQTELYANTLEHMLWSCLEQAAAQNTLYASQLELLQATAPVLPQGTESVISQVTAPVLSSKSVLNKQPRALLQATECSLPDTKGSLVNTKCPLLDTTCSLLEPVRLDLALAVRCLQQIPHSSYMSQVLYTLAQLYLSHNAPCQTLTAQPTSISNFAKELSIAENHQTHQAQSTKTTYVTAQNSAKLTLTLLQTAVKPLDEYFPQKLSLEQAVDYVLDPSLDAMCCALKQTDSRILTPNKGKELNRKLTNKELNRELINKELNQDLTNKVQPNNTPKEKLSPPVLYIACEDLSSGKAYSKEAPKQTPQFPCSDGVPKSAHREQRALIIDSSLLLGRLSAIAALWDLSVLYFQVPHVALNPSGMSWGKVLFSVTEPDYENTQNLDSEGKLNLSLGQRTLERFLMLQATRLGTAEQRSLGWNLYLSQIVNHNLKCLSFVRSLKADPAASLLLSYLYLGGITVRCDFAQAFVYCQQALDLILQQDKEALTPFIKDAAVENTKDVANAGNAVNVAKARSCTDTASLSLTSYLAFNSSQASASTHELKGMRDGIRDGRQSTGFLKSVLQDSAKLARKSCTEHQDHKEQKRYRLISLVDLQSTVAKEQQTKVCNPTFGTKQPQLTRLAVHSTHDANHDSKNIQFTDKKDVLSPNRNGVLSSDKNDVPSTDKNELTSSDKPAVANKVLSLRRKPSTKPRPTNLTLVNPAPNKTAPTVFAVKTTDSKVALTKATKETSSILDSAKLDSSLDRAQLENTHISSNLGHASEDNLRKRGTLKSAQLEGQSEQIKAELDRFEVKPEMLEKALAQLPETLFLHGRHIPRSAFLQQDHYSFLLPEIFALQTGLYLRGYGIGQNSEQSVCAMQRWVKALEILPLAQAVFLCDKTEWIWSWLDQPQEKFVQYVQKQAAHGDKAAILLMSVALAYGLLGLKIDLKKSQYWADLATKHHTMAFKPQRNLVRFMLQRLGN